MSTSIQLETDTPPQRVKCMEVHGGNAAGQRRFAMPGLDIWLARSSTCPSGVHGGDVHFLSSCASGRITRVLLAEICGSGSVFSDLASDLRDLMVRNINTISDARFVRDIHGGMGDFAVRGGFATALLGTFFAPTRSFSLCNAGHPLPFLYRARTGEWSPIRGTTTAPEPRSTTPPGVMDRHEYQETVTRLDRDDIVLLYSDALTQCRDSKGQYLGSYGLLQLLQQTDPSRPWQVLRHLTDKSREFSESNRAGQEATILLFRGTDRAVGWKNSLLAPFRLMATVRDNTRLG